MENVPPDAAVPAASLAQSVYHYGLEVPVDAVSLPLRWATGSNSALVRGASVGVAVWAVAELLSDPGDKGPDAQPWMLGALAGVFAAVFV